MPESKSTPPAPAMPPASAGDPVPTIALAVADFLAIRVRRGERPPDSIVAMFGRDAKGAPSVHVMAWHDEKIADSALVAI